MAASNGTLGTLTGHIVRALAPLKAAVEDEAVFRTLLARLAWEATSLPPEYVALASKVDAAITALDALADDPTIAEVLAALDHVRSLYAALQAITTAPVGVDPVAFLEEITVALIDRLLIDYLIDQYPNVDATFRMLGIITQEFTPATAGRPSAVKERIAWSEIPTIISSPSSLPARLYGWGNDDFTLARVAPHLRDLFLALGWPAYMGRFDQSLGEGFFGTAAFSARVNWALKIVAVIDQLDGEEFELGLALLDLPAEGSSPPGVVLQPLAPSALGTSYPISENLRLELRAGSDVARTFGVMLRPPNEISVKYPLEPGAELPSAGFGAALVFEQAEPFQLFGGPTSTRLECKSAKFLFDLNLKQGDLELRAGIGTEDLTLVLAAGDSDGFVASLLGAGETRIALPLELAWSNRTGLSFLGGSGFEISVYPHLDLGIIRFDRVDLGVRSVSASGSPAQLDIRIAAAVSGSLGPIAYTIDGLGIHMPMRFEPGNAGPFDVSFDVLRPIGIGLVIDAGAVTGGGFIKVDPDRGRYVGMIELKMFEIAITAIGILDTKDAMGNDLPSPGFSFFISLAAEISPIQLGYGFTLNGIGGLAGIHRRMDKGAILSGVRQGALDAIMFPDDSVANATTIISNLTSIFPIAMNRYVFGPMAIIGWGTPTLVKVELAVILEVPSPILLALLGKAAIAIPAEDAAIISINIDVVGILDFGRSLFAVDATLRDSYIAGFSLSGDMAMRLAWGEKANFALAVGGFNPHFAAPDGFPSLRRITVALGMGENPRVSLEGYFAVTSNSLQFGAKAELYASEGGFNIRGWLSFDTLMTVEPLWCQFDFAAGMTLNRGQSRIAGITIRGTLTGPSPFHAWGEGCISLLFFDVCVPFDATFGEAKSIDLADQDPWPLLEAAIKASASWSAVLAPDIATAVSVRPAPPGSGDLILHPMGAATLRQKVLPFNRSLERFGEFEITGPTRYDISDVALNASTGVPWTPVTDHFAPGNYESLSETEKLSRDSFEDMDAGVSLGSGLVGFETAALKIAKVTYETRIIDAGWKTRVLPPFLLSRVIQMMSALRGAKASSPLTRSGRGKFARDSVRATGVVLEPETYVVATTDTLARQSEEAPVSTRGAAHLAIKERYAPEARRRAVQVVPAHELELAA